MKIPPDNDRSHEEIRLIARVGAGDRVAFQDLYGRYSFALFGLAVRMVGDHGEAEEMLQDTFVKIWRHAGSYDPRLSRPFTWAVTIMRRTCIDQLRKRRRLPPVAPLPAEGETTADFSTGETVRLAVERQEDDSRLRGALGEIEPTRRRALEFALFSDLTHHEISQALDQPLGTVKAWIRRGLLELRTTLRKSAL